MRKHTTIRTGFTLIELLVVISIIGLLSSVVLASLNTARAKAKTATVQAELKQLRTAFTMMAIDTGYWPGNSNTGPQPADTVLCGSGLANEIEDLGIASAALLAQNNAYPNWKGPYMNSIPLDPWGHKYFFDTDYDLPGNLTGAVIGSYGPNGVGLNLYDSDDVIDILVSRVCP